MNSSEEAEREPAQWRLLLRSFDLSFFCDAQGLIEEVVVGDGIADGAAWSKFAGHRWADVLAVDSQGKGASLLSSAVPEGSALREVNLSLEAVGDLPFRFRAIRLGDAGHVLLVGRDQRTVSALQQQMVSLQQSTDREYARLRQADTRYRLFFHASAEAVLVVDVNNGLRVVEANPAAAALLEAPVQELMRARATDFLAPASRPELESFVASVVAGARPSDLAVTLYNRADQLVLSASLFRQAGVSYAVLRVSSALQTPTAETKRSARVRAVVDAIPDGFVVVGEDRRILSANAAFCELVQEANEKQVIGEPLDRWLGRAGVDINIIMANLREHGSIRNFSTILRSDVGAPQEALVTGVSVLEGKVPCIGFVIRVTRARLFSAPSAVPHSVEQLRELVGRVSLKELVRQSADLIERMCIEAALDVSGNNRASAAQLLGLSRQGLYSKLRRHGMGASETPT